MKNTQNRNYNFLKFVMVMEGEEILRIREIFGIDTQMDFICSNNKGIFPEGTDKAIAKVPKFEERLKKEKKYNDFSEDIVKLIKKYNLGTYWFYYLELLIISNMYLAPIMNIKIEDEYSKKYSKKIVKIEIGPNTTLNDLKEAWCHIKNTQERVYGKFKKIYLPDNIGQKLVKYIERENLKEQKGFNDLEIIATMFEDKEDENSSVEKDLKRVNNLKKSISRLKKRKPKGDVS